MKPSDARRVLLALMLWFGLALPVAAEGSLDALEGLAWMDGEEIRKRFTDKDLAGIYPNSSPWTERIRPDGTSDYREGGKHWQGEWWLADRDFCFRYPPPGMGGCFRVVQIGSNCYELYETTGVLGRAEQPPASTAVRAWNGRMWLAAFPPTCERPIS